MNASLTDTVVSGPFLLAAGLAVAAGAVSFASPCVLPLVPGYISYLVGLVGSEGVDVAGAPGAAVRTRTRVRTRAIGGTALFVLGFTVVFLLQFAAVFGLSHLVLRNADLLTRVGGVVTIIVGLAMLGFVRPLQAERRIHARPSGRVWGAPLLGAFFALGWTVCLGPTLVGVLSLASASDWGGSAWRGLLLCLFYCAGLGIPFLLVALGFGWMGGTMTALRRWSRTIQIVGAIALIAVGVAMVTGLWGTFISWLQVRFPANGSVL